MRGQKTKVGKKGGEESGKQKHGRDKNKTTTEIKQIPQTVLLHLSLRLSRQKNIEQGDSRREGKEEQREGGEKK